MSSIAGSIARSLNAFEGEIIGKRSSIPILGRAIAAIKIPLGALVFTTALAVLILGGPVALYQGRGKSFTEGCLVYMVSGLLGIGIGAFEVVPLIGLLISYGRSSSTINHGPYYKRALFLPYDEECKGFEYITHFVGCSEAPKGGDLELG